MLVCFGAAWPLATVKSWKSRTAKGTSLSFLLSILTGYVAGSAKVVLTEGWTAFLMIPYSINLLMLSANIVLYFRNQKIDRLGEAGQSAKTV
ncbi:MAG: hypothetical protein LBS00_00140 [Synergistaceae bacterium]|nr:hypothetical protein [Synergistaceae bacterium]